MISNTTAASDARDTEALSDLVGELRGYNVRAILVADQTHPYVQARAWGFGVLNIYVTTVDGEDGYDWDELHGQHPLCDPAGAARRIATRMFR